MNDQQPEESQSNAIGMQSAFQPSAELQMLLNDLSQQQANGAIHIAKEEIINKRSLTSILLAPDRPCSYSTFWSKERNGWMHKPKFVVALEMARREVKAHKLATSVNDAVQTLKLAAVDAAQELHRQITGDVGAIEVLSAIVLDRKRTLGERTKAAEALGEIGSQAAADKLLIILSDESLKAQARLRRTAVSALGRAAAAVNTQRRLASTATLDRADRMTASKGDGDRVAEELSDEELEAIARQGRGGSDGTAAPAAGAPTSD